METAAEVDTGSFPMGRTNLLPFEAPRDHRLLCEAIRDHIAPCNLLEEIWSSEILDVEWEIRRLQHFKRQIINSARSRAVRSLLRLLTHRADPQAIDELAFHWGSQKTAKKKVAAMLDETGLDESAIDAEAYRLSLGEIVLIDRRLSELVKRRDEVFRQIEDYRAATATPVRSRPKTDIQRLGADDGAS